MPARLALVVAAVLLALPTSASAAVSLGQTYPAADTCGANTGNVQLSGAAPGYRIDAPGVITELRTEGQTATGMRLHVFRPRGSGAYTVLGSVAVTPAPGVIRVPAQIAVQPGDLLGNSSAADPDVRCGITTTSADDIVAYRNAPTPDSGDTTFTGAQSGRLNVAATLEPDGDGDGYGDETQDRCPDDAGRTTQDCSADLFVSQRPVEADIERDDVNVITIDVRNNGPSLARSVRVLQGLPPGVQLVATVPTSGGCAGGAPVDCTFPSIPSGATGTVLVVVRAVSTGRKTLNATASSPTPDPNQANNADELEFDVNPRRSVTEPGAFCRVPSLRSLTRAAARKALEAAGCRLGRTSRKRYRFGSFSRVRAQSIPAGTRVATKTRVGITLRRR